MNLLPQDRYIARMIGLSDEQMLHFKKEVERLAAENPPTGPVADIAIGTLIASAIINTIIGVGITFLASLLAPKSAGRGKLTTVTDEGATLASPSRLAPRYGFNSVQDIAPLGETIPLVYANREKIDNQWYGGVRTNMPLLWSQLWSLGKGQMLRALFMVGEGPVVEIDPFGFAIGNNTLGAYVYNSASRRVAFYAKNTGPAGGRIAAADRISGAAAARDIGAAGLYSTDIYRADESDNEINANFCGTYSPAITTKFGVYSPISNGLGYRVNPTIRPLRRFNGAQGEKNNKYNVDDDSSALATAWTYKWVYSSRTGIIDAAGVTAPGATVDVQVDATIEVRLSKKGDHVGSFPVGNRDFPRIVFDEQNTDNEENSAQGTETLLGIATAVASRQKQYDAALVEGELYMIGTALCIMESRTEEIFVSEAEYGPAILEDGITTGPRSVSAIMRVVRPGRVRVAGADLVTRRQFFEQGDKRRRPLGNFGRLWELQEVIPNTLSGESRIPIETGTAGYRHYTATSFPQIFRCAIASFIVNRPTKSFEVGIVSQVGMRISGMCNFGDLPSVSDTKLEQPSDVVNVNFFTGSIATGTFVETDFVGDKTIDAFVPGSYVLDTVVISVPNVGSGVRFGVTISQTPGAPSGYGYVSELKQIGDGDGNYDNSAIIEVPDSELLNILHPDSASLTSTYRIRGQLDALGGVSADTGEPKPAYLVINERAADAFNGLPLKRNYSNTIYQSGIVSGNDLRYSFFRIWLRDERSDDSTWQSTGANVFGVAGSQSDAASFNWFRFDMNQVASWEVRYEPVTGWEIRNGHHEFGALSLYLVESGVKRGSASVISLPIGTAGSIYAQARALPNNRDSFLIQSLQPQKEPGLTWTEVMNQESAGTDWTGIDPDSGTFIDNYARVAETFVYDEITTSAESSPEHEIAYVNVVVDNQQIPLYQNMSLVGMNIRSSQEWQQLSQVSAYVLKGLSLLKVDGTTGHSHLWPDILHDYLLNSRYGIGSEITQDMIDTDSFLEARTWCADNRFFFDGVKTGQQNWRQWAADVSAAHCLLFLEIGGKFYLKPALPSGVIPISNMFTAGNCISIDITSAEAESRVPIAISAGYREEDRLNTGFEETGVFPVPKEIQVSLDKWAWEDTESLDVENFCTSKGHAVKASRYIIVQRFYGDHTISIKTTADALVNPIRPGDYIKVQIDKIAFTEGVSGFVDASGVVQTSTPLAPGEYPSFVWDGDNNVPVRTATITVNPDGTLRAPNGTTVFTLALSQTDVRTYQIDSIQPSEEGFEISAVHAPVNGSGQLLARLDWDNDAIWTEVE